MSRTSTPMPTAGIARWSAALAVLAAMLGSLSLLGVVGVAGAQSGTPEFLVIERGTHELLRIGGSVQRVAVGDPEVADVNVINRREVLVTGKQPGVTSLLVWRRDVSDPQRYRVRVRPPEDQLTPDTPDPDLANATVKPGQLGGQLPSLAARARAGAQAATDGQTTIDQSVVAIDTQVMAEIKIVEVSRTTLQQYGFNFLRNSGNTTVAVSPPGVLSGVTPTPGNFGLQSNSGFRAVQDAFQVAIGDATNTVLGVISLLERRGLARTLAEPSLVATSGQTATFLAGGEFPVPVVQGNSNSVSVEFKEFGVRLAMTPTVLSAERISLKVAPEVSELDFNSGIQTGGVAVPGLAIRRTDTTIELNDGESFVISGLISQRMLASVDKIPLLGDIPILGAFFRSSRYTRDERELIMVVTPRLVRPFAAGQTLPPLPGQALDDYRPEFERFMLFEDGGFDDVGFSD